MKKILIIAGPNGAGKTTFAREFLPNEAACPEFINADLIAAGISPFRPENVAVTAGRLMLQRINELVDSGKSFAFETTLSSRSFLRMIPIWKAKGYNFVF
jgi:predicted ABC-type ATPase